MAHCYSDSVRFVFFDTGYEGYEYATHGGSLFLVDYRERVFGVTCRHVLGDFDWRQLVVTNSKHGEKIAGLSAVYYASEGINDAVSTDVLDLLVIEFSTDIDRAFFEGTAFRLLKQEASTTMVGDELEIYGALKSLSIIDDETIAPKFARLTAMDQGLSSADPTLKKAIARYNSVEFDSLIGLKWCSCFQHQAQLHRWRASSSRPQSKR